MGKRRRGKRVAKKVQAPAVARPLAASTLGHFAGHLLRASVMLAFLLLVSLLASVMVDMLALVSDDPALLQFAHWMHLALMWLDGLWFLWLVLYSITARDKEES